LVLCHYVHCCLLQSVRCLSVPHNVPFVGSMPLCPLLSSTVCPLSVSTSHCTVPCFCATMSTAVFYSLSTVCQYLTLFRLLVLCHYVHCCLLNSVRRLSVPHNVPPVGSMPLCPLLSSTVCPLSVSTSHCSVCWFCHYVHCCLLQSVRCLSVPHNVPFVGSMPLCPLLSSTVCLLSVSTSHCTVPWFCATMSTAVFYRLSTVCQYLILFHLLVPCHYVHCCLLQSVHCLSVPHTVPSVGSMPLCPLLSPTVCPLSVSTSHCTVPWFCATISTAVFYSLSTVCQYLTLYRSLVLCHYVHCCLLQSVHCLSVPHTVPSLGSVSLCPLLSSTVCPLSVSTSQCTVCWFYATKSTAVFYSLSTVCQYLTLYRSLVLCPYVHCCLLQSVSTSHCSVCWFCVIMSTVVSYSLSTVCQYLTLHLLTLARRLITLLQ